MSACKVALLGAAGKIGRLVGRELDRTEVEYVKFSSRKDVSDCIHLDLYEEITEESARLLSTADVLINCIGSISSDMSLNDELVRPILEHFRSDGLWIQLSSFGVYDVAIQGIITELSQKKSRNQYEASKTSFDSYLSSNLASVSFVYPSVVLFADRRIEAKLEYLNSNLLLSLLLDYGCRLPVVRVDKLVDLIVQEARSGCLKSRPPMHRHFVLNEGLKLGELGLKSYSGFHEAFGRVLGRFARKLLPLISVLPMTVAEKFIFLYSSK